MPRTTPYGNFNFRVEISGVEAGWFRSVDGLSAELESAQAAKIPGLHKVSNVTLKRGVLSSARLPRTVSLYGLTPTSGFGAAALYDWYKATPGVGGGARKNLTLVVRNLATQSTIRYNLVGCTPRKWNVGSQAPSPGPNNRPAAFRTQAEGGAGIEEATFVCQSVEALG
ncbi:MAG: hypothetical protein GC160_08815 [Acidobacteria bacterium]|nr:hypothetical protein [Acidobacteriota bacterium]